MVARKKLRLKGGGGGHHEKVDFIAGVDRHLYFCAVLHPRHVRAIPATVDYQSICAQFRLQNV
jgi:hypothetical protein